MNIYIKNHFPGKNDTVTKPSSAVRAYSGREWKAVKNGSWGSGHKASHGEREGYVICYQNRLNEMVALASVIGQPFVKQTEIDANARLLELAPEMAKLVFKIAEADTDDPDVLSKLLQSARTLAGRLEL